jgi:hypothetical protein
MGRNCENLRDKYFVGYCLYRFEVTPNEENIRFAIVSDGGICGVRSTGTW